MWSFCWASGYRMFLIYKQVSGNAEDYQVMENGVFQEKV